MYTFYCNFANMRRLFFIALAAFLCISLSAQTKYEGVVEVDHSVHDFGDVFMSAGPVSCTFKVRNISSAPMTIFSVSPSCGCTDVKWTRDEIPAGGKGEINATYSNDEGAYPFDKTLTCYVSGVKKPIVLHLRGVSREKEKPLGEMYPIHMGDLAFRDTDIKAGNLSQGEQKSSQVKIANIGKKPVKVTFKDVSPGLTLKVEPATIPAGSTATLHFNITADRDHWGKNYYYATPVVDGKVYKAVGKQAPKESVLGGEALRSSSNKAIGEGKSVIGFYAYTKENFSSWTKDQKKNGATPVFESTSFHFGHLKAGKGATATFTYTNKGKQEFIIYKAESDMDGLKVKKVENALPGKSGKLTFTLDTTGMEKGEATILVNLTTNSPSRPLLTLYITGVID